MSALQFIAISLSLFTALGLVCAVLISRPRNVKADPHAFPFGDGPHLCTDLRRHYSQDQLEDIARRPPLVGNSGGALRRNEIGGRSASLSGTVVDLTLARRKA
ncbi:MAG: hypothetical protein J0H40_17905 [Rhizobiales bacterium]|nr:hypothetical protein [Hyphomicrobiales bacterium]